MGGTHHVNEQWQSYWIEKFKRRGYDVLDVIRPHFWKNSKINVCYRQDMLLFVKKEKFEDISEKFPRDEIIYDFVHPDGFSSACDANKLVNRRFLMKHLPEKVFQLLKEIYLIFGKEEVH